MKPAIYAEKLSMQYDGKFVLNALDLEVASGEVFGFLGHNGAGKTTTLSILTTLLKPTSGKAKVAGFDVVSNGFDARRCMGYLPENVRLYEKMSASDNLRFFAQLSGIRHPKEEITQTLKFLECEDLAERRVGSMSKGQRQRIGLAQAILHHPEIIFLDEPTSGLDPLGIKILRDLIIRLNKERGTTIFMNTHLISEVAKTCTSIGVLNHGHLVFHDTIAEVLNRFGDDTALENLYLSLVPGQDF